MRAIESQTNCFTSKYFLAVPTLEMLFLLRVTETSLTYTNYLMLGFELIVSDLMFDLTKPFSILY